MKMLLILMCIFFIPSSEAQQFDTSTYINQYYNQQQQYSNVRPPIINRQNYPLLRYNKTWSRTITPYRNSYYRFGRIGGALYHHNSYPYAYRQIWNPNN